MGQQSPTPLTIHNKLLWPGIDHPGMSSFGHAQTAHPDLPYDPNTGGFLLARNQGETLAAKKLTGHHAGYCGGDPDVCISTGESRPVSSTLEGQREMHLVNHTQ